MSSFCEFNFQTLRKGKKRVTGDSTCFSGAGRSRWGGKGGERKGVKIKERVGGSGWYWKGCGRVLREGKWRRVDRGGRGRGMKATGGDEQPRGRKRVK